MDPVTCDGCDQEFVPKPYEKQGKGGVTMQFDCPSCRRTYPVAFISTGGLKIRRQMEKARRRSDVLEVQRLGEELQSHVTRLS